MADYKVPTVKQLLDAGVHFGHQAKRWNPEMEPYIFAQRFGIHVIDLEQTHSLLEKASEFLHDVAATGGQIIFVGTKKQARDIVRLEAQRCGALYVTERWVGGSITNYLEIKKNLDKYVSMVNKRDSGEFSKYTKKERLMLDREITKLESAYGGIVSLTGTPAAVFVVDVKREKTAVLEARKNDVPVAALLDTNSDPTLIDYPIPGNDDAIRSIVTVVKVIADAVESGYAKYAKSAKKQEEEKAEEAVGAKETKTASETPVEEKSEEVKAEEEESGKSEKKDDKKDATEDKKVKKDSSEKEEKVKKTAKSKKTDVKASPKKKRGRPKKEDK